LTILVLVTAAVGMHHVNKAALNKDKKGGGGESRADVVADGYAADVREQGETLEIAAADVAGGRRDVVAPVADIAAAGPTPEVKAAPAPPPDAVKQPADVKTAPEPVPEAAPDVTPAATDAGAAAAEVRTADAARPAEVAEPGESDGPGLSALTPTPPLSDKVDKKEEGDKKERDKKERDRKQRDRKDRDRHDRDSGESGGYDGLMSKGNKLRKSGKHGDALKYFLKAAQIKPKHPEVQSKIGECYRRTGKCGSAVKYYQNAISTSGYKQAYIGIARCYISQGKKAEAKKYLEEGLRKYSNDFNMKMLLKKVGN